MADKTVLVVDDSATDSYLMCSALSTAGYNALAVDSAAEAVSVAKEERPLVILMDLVMPGTNGFQAIRLLRKDPDTAGIPIIIVSSKSKASDKVWGLRQGATGYITKPFSDTELVEKIKQLTVS